MLVNFYRLRREATIETSKKYSLEVELSFLKILYSCLYDILWFKVVCSQYGYVVYFRNSYFNIGLDSCCTILKEFTTKDMRKKGISRELISRIKYSTKLITGDSYDEESEVIGYIKSIQ